MPLIRNIVYAHKKQRSVILKRKMANYNFVRSIVLQVLTGGVPAPGPIKEFIQQTKPWPMKYA
jgi:hypothetical protein